MIFFQKTILMCEILYFFLIVCNKPHANPTNIYENIKEIHILVVGGTLEFPILSHMLLHRDNLHNVETAGETTAVFPHSLSSFTLFCYVCISICNPHNNAKVKTWHICLAISHPSPGLEAVITNDWCKFACPLQIRCVFDDN